MRPPPFMVFFGVNNFHHDLEMLFPSSTIVVVGVAFIARVAQYYSHQYSYTMYLFILFSCEVVSIIPSLSTNQTCNKGIKLVFTIRLKNLYHIIICHSPVTVKQMNKASSWWGINKEKSH